MKLYEEKEDYITVEPRIESWSKHANVEILKLYKEYISGSVLDVGCNHGASATYWLTKNSDVTLITGVDVQSQVETVFLNIMSSGSVPTKFINADFTKPMELPTQYDTIISFHTLEHIYDSDVDIFAENIFKNLKSGGYFIISIPYLTSYEDPHHVAFYDEEVLTKIFNSIGFTTIECLKDDRWAFEKDLLTAVFKK